MKPPTLIEYINKFHDWFVIDNTNCKLIQAVSLYCERSKSFETTKDKDFLFADQNKLYLDKGLLIVGNVGTGKTALLKMINHYYNYIGGERKYYWFRTASITDLADDFSIRGRDAFSQIRKGNWMFDELCFINEKTGKPDREIAINYGDKILIGEKVVYDRYNTFMEYGWQSHFTTNASTKQIQEIYGERVYSRLLEMCNFIFYVGQDRRKNKRPVLPVNRNLRQVTRLEPEQPKIEEPAGDRLTINVEDEMTKASLQKEFEAYARRRNLHYLSTDSFWQLEKFGCQLPDWNVNVPKLAQENEFATEATLELGAKMQAVAGFYDSLITSGKKLIDFSK